MSALSLPHVVNRYARFGLPAILPPVDSSVRTEFCKKTKVTAGDLDALPAFHFQEDDTLGALSLPWTVVAGLSLAVVWGIAVPSPCAAL